MEAENGPTKAIYLRTNHIEIARSRSTTRTGKKTVREMCRLLEIHEQINYRWPLPLGTTASQAMHSKINLTEWKNNHI
jgi:hypothetical protein